jgi:dTDP-4-amino-4,6-dideoxygalactose transaminase
VDAFERAVASFVSAKYAVAVNSGTAALHCAVFAAGAGAGHEVITSPLTFVASANAVLYQGGVPIFADIRSDTLMLDPAEVAARVSSRTRAIVPVDFAGQPCDLDELLAIAREHDLLMIEDAAGAPD